MHAQTVQTIHLNTATLAIAVGAAFAIAIATCTQEGQTDQAHPASLPNVTFFISVPELFMFGKMAHTACHKGIADGLAYSFCTCHAPSNARQACCKGSWSSCADMHLGRKMGCKKGKKVMTLTKVRCYGVHTAP